MPRLIDADTMREEWLENGENEYVYDTNAVLDSIDSQPTVNQWIPVTERMPEDDLQNKSKAKQIKVLVAYKTGNGCWVTKTQLRRKGRHFWYWSASDSVTHWMPLPDAPKEETE
jgi:hypothetical protein